MIFILPLVLVPSRWSQKDQIPPFFHTHSERKEDSERSQAKANQAEILHPCSSSSGPEQDLKPSRTDHISDSAAPWRRLHRSTAREQLYLLLLGRLCPTSPGQRDDLAIWLFGARRTEPNPSQAQVYLDELADPGGGTLQSEPANLVPYYFTHRLDP